MSPDPAPVLAQVRALALALPAAAERLSHCSPGFHVEGGRFFGYFRHDHHGDGKTAVIVRTSGADEQAMLIEADPALYYSPPYLGPSGWVAMRLTETTSTGLGSVIASRSAGSSPPRVGC